jgi:hypothetical protein
MDALDLRAIDFHLDGPVPADPGTVAAGLGDWLRGELQAGTLDHPVVVLFHRAHGIRYDLPRELPCSLDALVRGLLAHRRADAVATVEPRDRTSVRLAVEAGRTRVERALDVTDGITLPGAAIDGRLRWLGLPAEVDLQILPPGPPAEA